MADDQKKSQTEESFRKYRKALKPEIGTAKTTMHNAQKDYEGAVRSQQFKRCLFKKAEAALAEYEGLLNGVMTAAFQDAINIDNSINGDDKRTPPIMGYVGLVANVNKAFTDALKALRDSKQKLWDVENTGYTLAEQVENSDQSEEKKWLKKITEFDTCIKDIAGDKKAKIQGKADKTNDLADDALEVAVKVAGINASINLNSLTALSKTLRTDCELLKKDIDDNIAFGQAQKKEAQDNLNTQNAAQSSTRAAIARARLTFAGLKNTEAFVRRPDCREGADLATNTRKELDELAKKIEKSFD